MRKVLLALVGRNEIALAVLIVLFGTIFAVASPYFLTLSNGVDLIEAYAVTTILAAGVFVVLVSGGIDVSFAAIASASQYVAAVLATRYGLSPTATIGAACLFGMLLGFCNAALTYTLRVASIIVTIATASIFGSLLIYFTDGTEIYDLPDWWTTRITFFKTETASGDIVRITLPIVVMAAVVIVTQLIMSRTRIGRQVYALGGNPEAAGRLGINVLTVQLFAYGYLGALSGLAGFVQAQRAHQAVPSAMLGTELNVLAVAILGGASLAGGVGSMTGVVLGVLLLAMLQNGLNLLGVSSYFFQVVIGLAILLSICLTGLADRIGAQRPRTELAP